MHPMCLRAQAHISAKLGLIREIKVSMESGEQARPFWEHTSSWACKLGCMQALCLHFWAHISAKFGWIRKMKVSMELGEHTRPIWVHDVTQALKLACMHIIFLHAQTQISAKFCHSSKIKESMESQDYFPYVCTYLRSCEGAGGPKMRPKASHRSQRPPNSLQQELERGAPVRLNVLVITLCLCKLVCLTIEQ